jgi:hypothetical protein
MAAIDLFVVPTIGFEFLYGMAILHLKRRELVWMNATVHPTAEWIARQITETFPWEEAPSHLIRDHPVAPRSPWQHGYAARVIGSIRRECLDDTLIFGEAHLRRTLRSYARYYNRARTHLSLAKDAPIHRPIHKRGAVIARPHLGGLHHEYARTK